MPGDQIETRLSHNTISTTFASTLASYGMWLSDPNKLNKEQISRISKIAVTKALFILKPEFKAQINNQFFIDLAIRISNIDSKSDEVKPKLNHADIFIFILTAEIIISIHIARTVERIMELGNYLNNEDGELDLPDENIEIISGVLLSKIIELGPLLEKSIYKMSFDERQKYISDPNNICLIFAQQTQEAVIAARRKQSISRLASDSLDHYLLIWPDLNLMEDENKLTSAYSVRLESANKIFSIFLAKYKKYNREDLVNNVKSFMCSTEMTKNEVTPVNYLGEVQQVQNIIGTWVGWHERMLELHCPDAHLDEMLYLTTKSTAACLELVHTQFFPKRTHTFKGLIFTSRRIVLDTSDISSILDFYVQELLKAKEPKGSDIYGTSAQQLVANTYDFAILALVTARIKFLTKNNIKSELNSFDNINEIVTKLIEFYISIVHKFKLRPNTPRKTQIDNFQTYLQDLLIKLIQELVCFSSYRHGTLPKLTNMQHEMKEVLSYLHDHNLWKMLQAVKIIDKMLIDQMAGMKQKVKKDAHEPHVKDGVTNVDLISADINRMKSSEVNDASNEILVETNCLEIWMNEHKNKYDALFFHEDDEIKLFKSGHFLNGGSTAQMEIMAKYYISILEYAESVFDLNKKRDTPRLGM